MTQTFTYTSDWNLLSTATDALGKITRYFYDTRWRLTEVRNALNNSTRFEYNNRGLVSREGPAGPACSRRNLRPQPRHLLQAPVIGEKEHIIGKFKRAGDLEGVRRSQSLRSFRFQAERD
jgi:YD repeat-containing protein